MFVLFLKDWQFTTMILTGVSKRFLIGFTGVLSNDDEVADDFQYQSMKMSLC